MLHENQRLGDFEILGRIGQGGMGAVFKARQISLQRIVALKTLQPFACSDPDYVARFQQEALAVAALSHPNLVQVYAAGEADGIHFFAMEYIAGETAHGRLERQGRVEPLEAIAIASHVAAALEHGWRKAGLIHRDIKPDNILLSEDGEVKLGDLGLAKSAGQSVMTQTGTAIGTPHYLSPEQAEGKRGIDLRTDIYSLGCTLFHLVGGQPPYEAESAMGVMLKHVSAPVPNLREVNPECPAELAALVRKMMQKAPADRLQTHAEVVGELRRIYDRLSGHSMPDAVAVPKRPVPAPLWIGLGVVVCVVVAALLVLAPWKKHASPVAAAAPPGKSKSVQNNAAAATPGASKLAVAASPVPVAAPLPSTPTPAPATPVAVVQPAATPVESAPAPASTPKPMTEVEKWFVQVDPPQQEAFQKQVVKPYDAGLADLRVRYLAAVDAAITKESAAGQLDAALAWRAERQAFAQAQNVPADDGGILPAILAVRTSYRQQLAKLVQERATQARALFANYDATLAKYQTLLTQRQRLDDALLLKTKRDALASEWLGAAPSATEPAKPPSAPAPAGELPVALAGTGKDGVFVNSLGMKFVAVPIVGGPTAGRQVLFSVWDTRVQDFEAFVQEKKRDWRKPPFEQEPTHPAVMVSWEDGQGFCAWLTAHERRRLPAGWQYRLPTDHEWSCAIGIGDQEDAAALPAQKSGKIKDVFPWGTQWPPPDNSGNYASEELKPFMGEGKFSKIKHVLPGYHDGFAATSPVGTYAANLYGLFDMGGNVWNWCEDWVDATQKNRVLRGASWNFWDITSLRSSDRYSGNPNLRDTYYGFRCVLSGPATSPPADPAVATNPSGGAPGASSLLAAAKDRPFVNTLGMKFVPVPISRGPTAGHKILVSIWDTRVQDYQLFVDETKHAWPKPPFEQTPLHPAVNVTWGDAKSFCTWLTERERKAGKMGPHDEYRLPNDLEWSNAVGLASEQGETPAARSGQNATEFPWGQDFPPVKTLVGNYRDETWHTQNPKAPEWIHEYQDGYVHTSPVGSFPANHFGLYDMGGNVWQWCEDWYDAGQRERVVRGGSWDMHDRGSMLSSHRTRHAPDQGNSSYGFRCVLEWGR